MGRGGIFARVAVVAIGLAAWIGLAGSDGAPLASGEQVTRSDGAPTESRGPVPDVRLEAIASDTSTVAERAASDDGTHSLPGPRHQEDALRWWSDRLLDPEKGHGSGPSVDGHAEFSSPPQDSPVEAGTAVDIDLARSAGATGDSHPTASDLGGCVVLFNLDGSPIDDDVHRLPAGAAVKARWWDCAESDSDTRYSMRWYRSGAATFDTAETIEASLFEALADELVPETFGPDDGVTRVWGRVVDENGEPVAADVTLSAPDGTEILTGRSDWVDGFYELFAVPEGPAHLHVTPVDAHYGRTAYGVPGRDGRGDRVHLISFETFTADFIVDVRGGVVLGEITDPDGISLGAATVQLIDEDGEMAAETEAGIYGTYIFADVVPGTYTVRARLDRFFDAWAPGVPTLDPDSAQVVLVDPDSIASADVVLAPHFTDLTSMFSTEIDWLRNRGITLGCATDSFCPDDIVTRAQMAMFLARALGLDTDRAAGFEDVDGIHAGPITAIATAGITQGCDPEGRRFCPNAPVTRAQMASFLARALALSGSTEDAFSDDSGSPHESNINAIRAAGITEGCTPDRILFCPNDVVKRGQMAAFMFRAFANS
jgi:hypothetical protein